MEPGRDKELSSQTLSEDEKRPPTSYSKQPHGGGLLGRQSRERRYFDSGDLALSAADRVTDNGEIKTGAAHPMRDSISRPYAPVPINSNVQNDANRDFSGMKSPIPEMVDSPLHQQNQKGAKNMRE
ncbi:hypothetical protein ASPCADRAFT_135374, partial [Aspergillus carbonarius ITEM 5010]